MCLDVRANPVAVVEEDQLGAVLSGMMIRGNAVPDSQSIRNAPGCNGINAIVIEQNQSDWERPDIPGYLFQNHTMPLPITRARRCFDAY